MSTVAVAQTVARAGDVEANLREHLRLAEAAAAERARVLVFPELSLTGYELGLARELAFDAGDPRLEPLIEAARAGGLTLVLGAPLRIGARLHLGALVLHPDRPPEPYTKQRLGAFGADVNPGGPVPPAERTVFEPGDLDPLVRAGELVGAIAVCADVGAPGHAERAARRGAGCYLASMFVVPAELEAEETRLAEHARRQGLLVAMANHGGPTGGLPAAGRSGFWSPTGERLVRLEPTGTGLALAHQGPGGWRARAVPV